MRNFSQVDVFGATPIAGNPVAVIHDADGLTDAAMQRIARWTNLSETTFLLAPTQPGADYRLRIFTPNAELSFAGHPTLGSAHAWVGDSDRTELVQECGAGLVQLRKLNGSWHFAAPPTLRSGPLQSKDLSEHMTALGISRNQQAGVFDNLSDVMEFVNEWSDKRHDLPFNTDGLVVKINDREIYDNLGMVGKNPRGAVAYKYAAEEATTIVRDIVIYHIYW